MTLTDAGAIVALVDKDQPQNARCRAAFRSLLLPLLTTWPAFAEAMYLLHKIGGWPLQRSLWQYVEEGTLLFHPSTREEQLQMKTLMEKYRDMPMDLADASLVAAAESLDLKRIFTIDSDFYVYRIHNKDTFEVVP